MCVTFICFYTYIHFPLLHLERCWLGAARAIWLFLFFYKTHQRMPSFLPEYPTNLTAACSAYLLLAKGTALGPLPPCSSVLIFPEESESLLVLCGGGGEEDSGARLGASQESEPEVNV